MKVGDLVKHKRFGKCYLVAKVDNSALVGVLDQTTCEVRYIAKGWVELISESR